MEEKEIGNSYLLWRLKSSAASFAMLLTEKGGGGRGVFATELTLDPFLDIVTGIKALGKTD